MGYTALHVVSRIGDSKCVEFLLYLGADLSLLDGKGLSPLDVAGIQATSYNTSNDNQFRVKLSEKGEVNEENSIHKVIKTLIDGGALMPKANIILKEGSVVNQRRMGVTALHTAVRNNDLHLTEYLLLKDACLMTWDEKGLSPVHLAVSLSCTTLLRRMIQHPGSILGIRDVFGRTPLHVAVENGWTDGVELLLEAGSDITATTNSNQTVLHMASERGRLSILEELLSLQESEKVIIK